MTIPVYLNDLGIVCALGSSKDDVAQRLFAGETGVQKLPDAVSDGTTLPYAPVVTALPEIPAQLSRFASRNLALALKALEEIDASIQAAIRRYGPERVAVVMGTSTSGISTGEDALSSLSSADGGSLPDGFDFNAQEVGSVAESIAVSYALQAPAVTISTACSSGAKALSTARRLIHQGLADAVICGGCDSRCQLTLNGFHSLSALTRKQCLPFSANRDGTMIGEGAAIFLLTGQPSGVELRGIGESSDAHNMTAPDPAAAGAIKAMQLALSDAGADASDIAYINLHGTATQLNDAMESLAVNTLYPESIPCSSSKSQVGHTLGAAGAIEAAFCWLTLNNNPESRLPPHCWDGIPDPAAPLAGLVTESDRLRQESGGLLMSNSYAFGGNNISVILGPCV